MKKLVLLAITILISFLITGASIYYGIFSVLTKENYPHIISNPKEYLVIVDVTENKLYLTSKGSIMKTYPVASGKLSSPSPVGDWTIVSKGMWGEGFGGYWMGLNVPWGEYGIHGTSNPYSIGGDESGGCIRMYSSDAKELYSNVGIGTRVKIYAGPFGPFGYRLRTLAPGDVGADVYEVQRRLRLLGFYIGNADGVYGEDTKKALLKFQRANHLPLSNYVNATVYNKLGVFLFE
jgi:hypothetical protein